MINPNETNINLLSRCTVINKTEALIVSKQRKFQDRTKTAKQYHTFKENNTRGWRNGSTVKSTGFSSKGPGIDFQHSHGGSLLSVTTSQLSAHLASTGISSHVAHRQAKHPYTDNIF